MEVRKGRLGASSGIEQAEEELFCSRVGVEVTAASFSLTNGHCLTLPSVEGKSTTIKAF